MKEASQGNQGAPRHLLDWFEGTEYYRFYESMSHYRDLAVRKLHRHTE
jgi:hypothetical protein